MNTSIVHVSFSPSINAPKARNTVNFMDMD